MVPAHITSPQAQVKRSIRRVGMLRRGEAPIITRANNSQELLKGLQIDLLHFLIKNRALILVRSQSERVPSSRTARLNFLVQELMI